MGLDNWLTTFTPAESVFYVHILIKYYFLALASVKYLTNISSAKAECYVPIRAHPHNPQHHWSNRPTQHQNSLLAFRIAGMKNQSFLPDTHDYSNSQVCWGWLSWSVHSSDALHWLDCGKHHLRFSHPWQFSWCDWSCILQPYPPVRMI